MVPNVAAGGSAAGVKKAGIDRTAVGIAVGIVIGYFGQGDIRRNETAKKAVIVNPAFVGSFCQPVFGRGNATAVTVVVGVNGHAGVSPRAVQDKSGEASSGTAGGDGGGNVPARENIGVHGLPPRAGSSNGDGCCVRTGESRHSGNVAVASNCSIADGDTSSHGLVWDCRVARWMSRIHTGNGGVVGRKRYPSRRPI